MKNLKDELKKELSWAFAKHKIALESEDKTIVVLKEKKSGKATFEFGDAHYVIHNKGFWNPATIIEKDGMPVLTLKRHFLGSKGEIIFEDGAEYSCKVRNAPLVKLSIFGADDKEILNYNLDVTLRSKARLKIVDTSMDEYALLMLIILGCYLFRGIVRENSEAEELIVAAVGT